MSRRTKIILLVVLAILLYVFATPAGREGFCNGIGEAGESLGCGPTSTADR